MKYIVFIGIMFLSVNLFSQVKVKALDPEMMAGKVLLIPAYNTEDPMIKRWERKGKTSKLSAVEEYTQRWERVMAQSSWDATPYEIRKFDLKKLKKEKNEKALVFNIKRVQTKCGENRYVNNYYGQITMMGPKRKVIAQALVNDLEWWDDNDLRLIINMLSNSLNQAMESFSDENGSGARKARNQFKEDMVAFMDEIDSKTFLVQKSALSEGDFKALLSDPMLKKGKIKKYTKRQEKAEKKDAAVAESMKSNWKMCDYEILFEDDIIDKRTNLDPNSFFWINIEINTCSPIVIGANRNHIFSTNGDKVLAAFAGKGKMKPATIDDIQKKLVKRYERYKKQLAK